MYKKRADEKEGETVLVSRIVESEGKRFNLELKKSSSGRFVKVTEVSQKGQEYRIFLAMSSVTEFRDKLTAFAKCCSSPNSPVTEAMKSMIHGQRRHRLSLKESPGGKYVLVNQLLNPSLIHAGVRCF